MSVPSSPTTCRECGRETNGEYHPYAICVLTKAGLSPRAITDFVAEAWGAYSTPGHFKHVRDLPFMKREAG